jgi:hypothetical protein
MGAVIRAAYERTVKGFHWLIAVGSRAESVPVIGPLLALPIVVLVVVPIAGFAIVGWLLAMSVALMALTGPPAFGLPPGGGGRQPVDRQARQRASDRDRRGVRRMGVGAVRGGAAPPTIAVGALMFRALDSTRIATNRRNARAGR